LLSGGKITPKGLQEVKLCIRVVGNALDFSMAFLFLRPGWYSHVPLPLVIPGQPEQLPEEQFYMEKLLSRRKNVKACRSVAITIII